MGGNMTFREALKKRLSIIRPTVNTIDEFNKIQKSQLTPYIKYNLSIVCPVLIRPNRIFPQESLSTCFTPKMYPCILCPGDFEKL